MMNSCKTARSFLLILVPVAVIGFWIGVESVLQRIPVAANALRIYPLLKTAPYLLALAGVFTAEKITAGLSWADSLAKFGFKWPQPHQIQPALTGIVILAVGYRLAIQYSAEPLTIQPNWPSNALKYFIQAGLSEEILFRGFLFRHLRTNMTFWRAAIINGAAFGLIHLFNFTNGFTPEIVTNVAISITFGFLLTFPLAALFEVGGGSLLGGVIFHFGVDTVNLFDNVGPTPMLICLGTAAFAGMILFIQVYRTLQSRTSAPSGTVQT